MSTFFLYPVIRVEATDEAEATNKVFEAIFTGGVGEIPGWCAPPPSFKEKRLQQAAPELLETCEWLAALAATWITDYGFTSEAQLREAQDIVAQAEAVIAKAKT